MTCERADDKCEHCGITVTTYGKVDFLDELLCPTHREFFTPHCVEEYIMDEDDSTPI